MRIGIYGGSFNPIHNGHIDLALQCLRALHLEKILVVPANYAQSKLKSNVLDAEQRLAMCVLACKDHANLEVSDLEVRNCGKNYTVNTLETISEMYPSYELFLLMGSDVFASVGSWYKFDEIKTMAVLCVVPRYTGEVLYIKKTDAMLRRMGARTVVVEHDVTVISSTRVRDRIRKNEKISDLVDSRVEQYILHRGLYK